MAQLVIKNLHVSIDDTEIIDGLSLTINTGEIHAVMGPNGTGKSTLAYTLMGHPAYEVTAGEITLDGRDVLAMEPNERALAGLFLAFQYPYAIPGVTVANFLRSALQARRGKDKPLKGFRKQLLEQCRLLEIDPAFAGRYVNDGFSGGEKKRIEILQMAMLQPRMAILDETDSGLDIDALRVVSKGINHVCGPEVGVLLVTHYQRILDYVRPDFVHVLVKGKIVRSGGAELARELEQSGYEGIEASEPASVEV